MGDRDVFDPRLRTGVAPDAIVKQIWEQDPDPLPDNWTKQGRQVAVMNLKGEHAAFTGPKATEWAGHKRGTFATAQVDDNPEAIAELKRLVAMRNTRRPQSVTPECK